MEMNLETEKKIIIEITAYIEDLQDDEIKKIQAQLDMIYVPEYRDGNLCFAENNTELRNAYKQVFAPVDLLNYLYAVLHRPEYSGRDVSGEILSTIPFPADSTDFWELVETGSKLWAEYFP